MELFKKNRLLFWLLIFLVIMNITAVATYFIYRQNLLENEGCEKPEGDCTLRNELGLSPVQAEKITVINTNYREIAEPVVEAIKEKRSMILDELSKAVPDTNLLYAMAHDLSELQTLMQRANIRQYLALKTIVTPAQALKLSALYRELYGCPMKEKGMQHRYRKGKTQKGCSEN
jgi:hypothetical protein